MSWLFPAESHSSGGFIIPELVIPDGKTIFRYKFLVYKLVIPGRINKEKC
jgi:hypothetical protein